MKASSGHIPAFLKSKISEIIHLCQQQRVKVLWAFGSVLTERFNAQSDIDLLYVMDRTNIGEGEYLPCLDGLIEGLQKIFPGRKLDLVHFPSLRNPYFIEEIEETKVLLYEQNREKISV